MAGASSRLETPFRQAIVYVVDQLREVSITKLEKILYLADLENFHATGARFTGARFTGARWVRHQFGPMAKTTVPSRNMMDGWEVSVTEAKIGPYDATIFRPGPRPRFRPQLTKQAQKSLDRIIEMTRSLNADDVVRVAYNTTPMLERLQVEEAEGHETWDVTLTFENHLGRIASIASHRPKAALGARIAFKSAEVHRVEDLQRAAIARSSES
jgi:hypothetical protein